MLRLSLPEEGERPRAEVSSFKYVNKLFLLHTLNQNLNILLT
jgi:hypothetical protein